MELHNFGMEPPPGLEPGPPVYETGAPPLELWGRNVAGRRGIEPRWPVLETSLIPDGSPETRRPDDLSVTRPRDSERVAHSEGGWSARARIAMAAIPKSRRRVLRGV